MVTPFSPSPEKPPSRNVAFSGLGWSAANRRVGSLAASLGKPPCEPFVIQLREAKTGSGEGGAKQACSQDKRVHRVSDDIKFYCLGSAAVSETTRYSYDLPFALNFILSLSSVNSMGVLMGINSLSRDFSCLMW